jgi:hypothetical protein
MRSFLALVAAAVACGAATFARAETDVRVERPSVKVGEAWVYRRTNLWNNEIIATTTLTVTYANEKAIHGVTTQTDSAAEGDTISTAEWNMVATGSVVQTPHSGNLHFPLYVGKSYDASYTWENTKTGRRIKHERVARVVGWEEVSVPAGRFHALKIDVEGPSQRLDAFGTGRTQTILWYAPEVKRWVKGFFEDGAGNRESSELIQFSLR